LAAAVDVEKIFRAASLDAAGFVASALAAKIVGALGAEHLRGPRSQSSPAAKSNRSSRSATLGPPGSGPGAGCPARSSDRRCLARPSSCG
jgi:hypothetical protein